MPDYSIGVDMGGTNLRIAAITTEGQLLEKITLGVKVALGRDYVIGEMCDAIQRLTGQYRNSGRFVGAGIGDDPGDRATVPGADHIPVRPFERRHIERGAVRRDRQAIAPAFVFAVPDDPLGVQVDRRHALDRGDVQTCGLRARRDALDGLGRLAVVRLERRNPFQESMAIVDVDPASLRHMRSRLARAEFVGCSC